MQTWAMTWLAMQYLMQLERQEVANVALPTPTRHAAWQLDTRLTAVNRGRQPSHTRIGCRRDRQPIDAQDRMESSPLRIRRAADWRQHTGAAHRQT